MTSDSTQIVPARVYGFACTRTAAENLAALNPHGRDDSSGRILAPDNTRRREIKWDTVALNFEPNSMKTNGSDPHKVTHFFEVAARSGSPPTRQAGVSLALSISILGNEPAGRRRYKLLCTRSGQNPGLASSAFHEGPGVEAIEFSEPLCDALAGPLPASAAFLLRSHCQLHSRARLVILIGRKRVVLIASSPLELPKNAGGTATSCGGRGLARRRHRRLWRRVRR